MLPVLKQAGVVDAGGRGLLYILEGGYESRNSIESIGDLRRIEVRELVGITESTKESIGWAREFYNLEPNPPTLVKKRGK